MSRLASFALLTLALGALAPATAQAQTTGLAFGQVKADPSQPVEVTSENLDVSQGDGTAIFTGDVLIVQGEMRLNADRVTVINKSSGDGIERLEARGNVVLVSGSDAAEAREADYTIDSGAVVMRGDVVVNQGPTVFNAQTMTVNLITGEAVLSGRVRTLLNTGTAGDQ